MAPLDSINSQLRTLTITILRADELPGLIGRCRYPSESQSLREEQATIGQPVALRVRCSQLDYELRQVNSVIGNQPKVRSLNHRLHRKHRF